MKRKTKKAPKKPIKPTTPNLPNVLRINGVEYNLPQELIQEIASKLKPSEPETFEDCQRLINPTWGVDGFTGEPLNVWKVYPANVASEKRARQLAAIAKMMTVADALNGDWKHTSYGYHIAIGNGGNTTPMVCGSGFSGEILFKSISSAEKAIKILGEETIKTAFGL